MIIVRGPVTCLRVMLAVPIGHSAVPGTDYGYSHRSSSSDRRSSVILLHVQVYGFSSPVHLRCRVRACLSLREAIGL